VLQFPHARTGRKIDDWSFPSSVRIHGVCDDNIRSVAFLIQCTLRSRRGSQGPAPGASRTGAHLFGRVRPKNAASMTARRHRHG